MNAQELYHHDGKPASVSYCSACRRVHRTKDQADECCTPQKCQYCGLETGRPHYTACNSCDQINRSKKEADRFDKAEKKTEWDGWVYLEGTGKEGYSESIADFWENWESDHDEGDAKPTYVWACAEIHFAVAEIHHITDYITDQAYDDFDSNDLNGIPDLEAALAKFNEANKDLVSYLPDYSVAVLLSSQQPTNVLHVRQP